MDAEEILRGLVQIPSAYPHEQEIAVHIESLLRQIGMRTTRVYVEGTERFNLIAERGEPTLGFFGHMDTVGAVRNWSTDPFTLTEKGDKLYGLGTYDMKGGLACILHAASETAEPVRIILSVDEENISQGIYALERASAFNGLAGVVSAEAGNSADFAGGLSRLTVSRRGRLVLECTVYGKSAHGAQSGGVNAIGRALTAYSKVESLNLRLAGYVKPSAYVRSIHADAEGLSVPERAVMEIDRHYILGEDEQSIRSELEGIFDKVYVKQRSTPYMRPFNHESSAFVQHVRSLITEKTGKQPTLNHALSVGDENVIAQHCPVAILGPAGGNEHAADEFVLKSSLHEISGLFKHLIRRGL